MATNDDATDQSMEGQGSILSVPMRKRTIRACDQCRRRKTKCDGTRPCATCSSIGLDCSYGSRIKQARGPSYVVHLERKVEELQNQVKKEQLNEDYQTDARHEDFDTKALHSPTSSRHALGRLHTTFPGQTAPQSLENYEFEGSPQIDFSPGYPSSPRVAQSKFVRTIGWPAGRQDAPLATQYGRPCGLEVLRRMRGLCSEYANIPAQDQDTTTNKLVESLDFSFSLQKSSINLGTVNLPPKDEVLHWIEVAFREIFCLWPFLERSTIEIIAHRIYHAPETFTETSRNRDEFTLIQIVVALGQRSDPKGQAAVNEDPRAARDRVMAGAKYFIAATRTIDIYTCGRSVVAMQVVLCIALYCRSINAMSLCSSFTTAAVAAALRMGLHEPAEGLSPHEQALRSRLWSTVRAFDSYSVSALGLPSQLCLRFRKDEPDDRYPALTDPRSNQELVASNAHSKLTDILGQVVELCYYGNDRAIKHDGVYDVQEIFIRDIESQLNSWAQKFSAGTQLPLRNLNRPQLMLELAYEYVRMLVFTPFMQHASEPQTHPTSASYEFACVAILAAIRTIHVARALDENNILNPSHPLIVHTVVFAAVVLLLTELGSMDDLDDFNYRDFRAASGGARDLLEKLSTSNLAASSCLESLVPLYECEVRTNQLANHARFDDQVLASPSMFDASMMSATTSPDLTMAGMSAHMMASASIWPQHGVGYRFAEGPE